MRNHSKAFRHFMIMMITGILILTGSLFCSGTANAKEGIVVILQMESSGMK